MIQLVFIVVPCALVGLAITFIVSRMGLLPTHEGFGTTSRARMPSGSAPASPSPGRSILERRSAWAPRPSYLGSSWSGFRTAGVAAIVVMALWIVFWVVLLFVGLHLIFTAA
ncbi:MAG: hypothetical protein ACRDZ8_13770 [Acidimicrobiales bacterium]